MAECTANSCLTNIILIPLATWLYLLALCITAGISLIRRTSSVPPYNNGSHCSGLLSPFSLGIIYALLLLATLAMVLLELGRLGAAGLSVELLPFTPVGLAVAALVTLVRKLSPRWGVLRKVSVAWWVLLGVMFAVGAGLISRDNGGADRAKYPVADQVTDRGVVAGLAFVLAGMEAIGVMGWW